MKHKAMVCWCGENARIRTSWTILNPGRRFTVQILIYRVGSVQGRGGCDFWVWYDVEMCESIGGVMDAYCNVVLWREWWIRWTEAEDFGIGMKGGVLGMHCAFSMGSTVLVV
ncbi:unnamed protein product [Prunus armeniaca]|uniref:Uncharacterized protein n=1 Tax=Prunus armeniaca TaxID=36596 RepID=A0A6J5TIB4_PRUAR|nr:unnamed protein product [Prunus armeniaca]